MCLEINSTGTELIRPEANPIREEGVGAARRSRVSLLHIPGREMLPKPEVNMSTQACAHPSGESSPHPPERQSSWPGGCSEAWGG